MKKEFNQCPEYLLNKENYGFDWKEHLLAIPSVLVVVTSYKNNYTTNATMQSWLTFTNESGYYAIFASVNKHGHMYKSIKETKACVINFPSFENYQKCYDTIKNNGYDINEIEASGLTKENAHYVNAPLIKECFLNLECEYVWEKELVPNGNHVVMCVKVVNVLMDNEYYDEDKKGRYGKTGYLYNIHAPINPDLKKEEETYTGYLNKYFIN